MCGPVNGQLARTCPRVFQTLAVPTPIYLGQLPVVKLLASLFVRLDALYERVSPVFAGKLLDCFVVMVYGRIEVVVVELRRLAVRVICESQGFRVIGARHFPTKVQLKRPDGVEIENAIGVYKKMSGLLRLAVRPIIGEDQQIYVKDFLCVTSLAGM